MNKECIHFLDHSVFVCSRNVFISRNPNFH